MATERITRKEFKELAAAKFGVKAYRIRCDYWFDSYGYAVGGYVDGKSYISFYYYFKEREFKHIERKYNVEYLRSTPFGYGGGWSSIKVEAESEEAAINKAESILLKEWGKWSPCSRFSIIPWDNY